MNQFISELTQQIKKIEELGEKSKDDHNYSSDSAKSYSFN